MASPSVFEGFRKGLTTLGDDISKTTKQVGENIKKVRIETQSMLLAAVEGPKGAAAPAAAADASAADASASAQKQEGAPPSASAESQPDVSPSSPPKPDTQPAHAEQKPPKTPVIPEDTARLADELGAGRPRPAPVGVPLEKSKSSWAVVVPSEPSMALRWGLAVGLGLVLVTAVVLPGPRQATVRLLRRLKMP